MHIVAAFGAPGPHDPTPFPGPHPSALPPVLFRASSTKTISEDAPCCRTAPLPGPAPGPRWTL